MRRPFLSLAMAITAAGLIVAGCSQAAPAPAPAPSPQGQSKAAEPTKTAAAQPTSAQAKKVNFPEKDKTITLLISWAAGGPSDVQARLMAPLLEKELGVPVQVVNRPGAGSQVGMTELARSKPDGYTVGLTNLPSVISPYMDPERKAVYARKDLQQIMHQVFDPDVIAVKTESKLKTVKDLVDAAKANPGKVKVSSTGVASDNHLAILMFEKAAGVQFSVVQFDGGAQATTALLGDHVDVAFQTMGTAAPHYKSGKLRYLGIMDTEESKFFPGVPTLASEGYKIAYGSSRGWSVPAGTPKEVVETLNKAFKKVMDDPEFQKKMEEQALPQRYMGPEEYAKYWDEFEAQTRPLIDLAKQQR
ncbi:MAG: Bug family tripartite tricarboxylate transporter substrate binding protein [Chloroflexota bacterium]